MKLSFDTNVLVYAADIDAGPRHARAAELLERAAQADCILTLQSLGEFFNATTKKARLPPAKAGAFVEAWRRVFPVHGADEAALEDAMHAADRHRLAFWDAMIWATARQAGCRLLISEDMQDGWSLGGLLVVNPFEPGNTALLDAALPSA